MSHYLVSGAAGFIAGRVCAMLLDQGHQVTGVDNLNASYDVRMKEYRLAQLQQRSGFTFLRADIGERAIIEKLANPAEPYAAIINLAARAGVRASTEDPWECVHTNLTGALNLLELARQTGVKKYILASTSSVYGEDVPLPTPEDAPSDRALQPYAATKKGAEVMAHSYHILYNIDVSVVRYFTVYGPAGRPDMIMFRLAKWISEDQPVTLFGDGEQRRGFTYVDDIARGTLAALRPLGYAIINLGGHETVSINRLVEMFEQRIGKQARRTYQPRHRADASVNYAAVERAEELLDWHPQVSLDEGIDALVGWYQREREWVRHIKTD